MISKFFNLLFEKDDIVIIKQFNSDKNQNSLFLSRSEATDYCSTSSTLFSESGVTFFLNHCSSAQGYIETLNFAEETNHSKENVPIQFTSEFFDSGRSFFIEADNDENGDVISTDEQRRHITKLIINCTPGIKLPFSYLLSTGGKGYHIGVVLDRPLKRVIFQQLIADIRQRLPYFCDLQVGKINQLERLPGSFRINKNGDRTQIKLLAVFERVAVASLKKWIDQTPTQRDFVSNKAIYQHNENFDYSEREELASQFILTNGLRANQGPSPGGNWQIQCPKTENHKNGDKNFSAFINLKTKQVHCCACGKVSQI